MPSPSIVFRHQHNASMNQDTGSSLAGFYGYKETFAKDAVWVDIPRRREWFAVVERPAFPNVFQSLLFTSQIPTVMKL